MSKFKTVEVKAPWIPKTNGNLNIHDVIQMVKKKSNITQAQCFTAENDKTIFKIWNTLCVFVKEQLLQRKNVNIRDFGAFSFDIATENPNSLKNNSSTDREELRKVNKTNHSIRPCFLVGKKLKGCLLRQPGKEETIKPSSQHSIYQQAHNAVYCNYYPIAVSCQLDKREVDSVLAAMFECIYQLVDAGRDLTLDFNFAHVYFRNKNMSQRFKETEFGIDNFAKDSYKDNLSSSIWKTDQQESFNASQTGSINARTDLNKLAQSISQKKNLQENTFDMIKIRSAVYIK